MFGISKSEIEERLAKKATSDLKEHGKVEIPNFGVLQYNKDLGTYTFYPDPKLEQALRD